MKSAMEAAVLEAFMELAAEPAMTTPLVPAGQRADAPLPIVAPHTPAQLVELQESYFPTIYNHLDIEANLGGAAQRLAESALAAPCYLAVDAENIYHSLEGKRVNYGALLEYAKGLGQPVRSAIYTPRQEGSDKERGFLAALKHQGYKEVIHKPWRTLPGGGRKSDMDVHLALDVWESAMLRQISFVILVSGDSDFIPLVTKLATRHIPTLVIGPENATSWELMVAATWYRPATKIEGFIH